ncbi:MAG: 1-acyl-sn-glycerol-3-phosphate acyltransferase [Ignavibacteria bacterium]|nr:MAG: 1-acyl-sn-glycerol-3-phosphate acyltransferase [Ignavibacteria bacterium]
MIEHGRIFANENSYTTPVDRKTSILPPTMACYSRVIGIVFSSSRKARRGTYDGQTWSDSSIDIFNALEIAGCRFDIQRMNILHSFDGPAVFVANHMSILETFILPSLINPVHHCTFVIKPSLMEYPVFKHVMRSRNPVVVSRDNPRQDLITVLEEGSKRLADGISIVLFPQTTRTTQFDPSQFNSLGVKLAKRAGVPVVPVALKTDAWSNGRRLKDFGPIDPSKTIHFTFGDPMTVEGNGKEQHEIAAAFIAEQLARWSNA